MQPKITYAQLESLIRKLYDDGDYEKIIELIDLQGENFPARRLDLAYWQITMAARIAQPTMAFYFMDELLNDGLWISAALLHQSPSLAPLHEMAEFNQRAERFAALQAREQAQLLPLLTLHQEKACGSAENPCALFLGLHDNYSASLDSIRFWQTAAARGWLVGVPQSSQARWSGAYVWDDQEIAQQEIEHHADTLKEKYYVNPRQIYLGGRGRGGEMAAWLLVSGGLPARGFVAVNPRGELMRDHARWMRLLQAAQQTGLRGALIAGADAPGLPLDDLRRTADIFNAFDVPCDLQIIPNAGAVHTPAYDEAMLQALDFITRKA